MKTVKDTDYLALSAELRVMETRLFSEAELRLPMTDEELKKRLREHGYPPFDMADVRSADKAFEEAWETLLSDLWERVPDKQILDCFRLRQDYRNAKAILKAELSRKDTAGMLAAGGRIGSEELRTAIGQEQWDELPETLADTVRDAQSLLKSTHDPRRCDLVLDRGMFRELTEMAEEIGSPFLKRYVQAQIDEANLRTLVRALRIGKETLLGEALTEGGSVPKERLLSIADSRGNGLAEAYALTAFSAAAEKGEAVWQGASLSDFEWECRAALCQVLAEAERIPFGEAPLIYYLALREAEWRNLRLLLAGRTAGIPAEELQYMGRNVWRERIKLQSSETGKL